MSIDRNQDLEELLNKIKEISLKKDLRVGQIFDILTSNKDIFSLENSDLLKFIEKVFK
jgi:spore coat polysaccharide biosynthesis protein SpsF (cytidylyltransferase family)